MAINQFVPQQSPFARLAEAVGTGMQVYGGLQDIRKKSRESDQEAMAADPNSELSMIYRATLKDAGVNVPENASAKQLESSFGKVSDYQQIKFKSEQDRKTQEAKLKQEKSVNPNKFEFERLPVENQEQIKDLSKGVAARTQIQKDIESALELLESTDVPEDQKVVIGLNLAKTLNSTQGKDAVGAEEVKRLVSYLEPVTLLGPGGPRLGRDLGSFTNQVKLKSAEIGQSVAKQKAQIDQLYGRNPTQITGIKIPDMSGGSGGRKEGTAFADDGASRIVDGVVFIRRNGRWEEQ
jgi:hypothetical protein